MPKQLEEKWYQKIPGYRSHTAWKMILASVFYLFAIIFAIAGISTGIYGFFGVLFLLSLVLFIAGLIKPQNVVFWSKKKNRKKSSLVYGILALVFIIIFSATAPSDPLSTSKENNQTGATTAVHKKDETKKSDSSKSKAAAVATKTNSDSKKKSDASSSKDNDKSSASSDASSSSTSSSKPKTAADSVKGLVAATITKEVDGDTIHVNIKGKDETIRMLLIDTPETHKPGTPVEPFGIKASAFAVGQMPVGTHVKLEIGKAGYTRDKYGRLLAFIYLPNGQLYNEKVVRKGLARVAYIYPPNTQHLDKLKAAQSYAKAHKLGIWSIPGYVTDSGYNVSDASSSTTSTTKKSTTSTSKSSSSSTSSSKSTSSTTTVSGSLNVSPGQNASVSVKTSPGARGTIQVIYNSGPSTAAGLDPKTADGNGNITWVWKVGTRTAPGDYPVNITVGGKSINQTLHVQ